MRQKTHNPFRTCIGCRRKREKGEMIWLVQGPEGVARVNAKKPHQGRGFYLCRDLQCLHMAGKKKAVQLSRTMDFQSLLVFFKERTGVQLEEEGNGKE